ncbi:YceD family protein [Lacisediminimonas profundi]|uniref:YceD family protein n=1 Tax=Lacisediminimonas profundi TaxID=2603856 RepID=UPI00124AE42F|nr:YceD family protein [Lacisediminimonas profundi]
MGTYDVDAFEFCRKKDSRSGETPVAQFGRLVAETLDQSGAIRWSVQGGINPHGNPQMMLQVAGEVSLRCQRCLGPMAYSIDSQAVVVVAADDEQADALDEQLVDEPVEVIVGSSALDLLALVEDEALLALPPAPRHDHCVVASEPVVPEEKKESPFAVLGKLKR